MGEMYQGYLYMSGQPCGLDRIAEIERNIGRQLPQAYAQFIMETGGGYLDDAYGFVPGDYLRTDPEGIAIARIYGNGVLRNSNKISLDDPDLGGPAIARIWEYPDEALLFAIGEGGAHVVFMLNYDFADYPKHAVLVFNDEMEHALVADSFEDFMQKLTKLPDWTS